jgi:hypothetical protein
MSYPFFLAIAVAFLIILRLAIWLLDKLLEDADAYSAANIDRRYKKRVEQYWRENPNDPDPRNPYRRYYSNSPELWSDREPPKRGNP